MRIYKTYTMYHDIDHGRAREDIPYSAKFSWHNIFVINPSFTKLFFHENYRHISDKNYRLPLARGGRGLTKVLTKFCSNHEIFTTKIKTFANLERFRKILCHENLELYIR